MRRLPFSFKSIIVIVMATVSVGFFVGHKTKELQQTALSKRAAASEAGI